MNRGRLEAFSDGVFAVAITLLALNLKVNGPGPGYGTLAHQLANQWAAYAAYVISFFTIGIIWVNHHALVSNVVDVSRTLSSDLWTNTSARTGINWAYPASSSWTWHGKIMAGGQRSV
jgi:uncharacterized membrane protein